MGTECLVIYYYLVVYVINQVRLNGLYISADWKSFIQFVAGGSVPKSQYYDAFSDVVVVYRKAQKSF